MWQSTCKTLEQARNVLAIALRAVVEMVGVMRTHVAAGLVGAALAAMAAWNVQAWRYGEQIATIKTEHAQTMQRIADKTTKTLDAVREYERTVAQDLADKDAQRTKEVADAKTETDRLRRCIAAGTCGVRIITKRAAATGACDRPTDTSASGVDSGASALDADVQRRILDLRDAISTDAAALSYLQDYARACVAAQDWEK